MYFSILVGIILLVLLSPLYAIDVRETISIYDNFSQVISEFSLELEKGSHSYEIDHITAGIDPQSIILTTDRKGLDLRSHSFEFDLLNTNKVLDRYIGKSINITGKDQSFYSGILQTYDSRFIILTDETNQKVTMLNYSEILNIGLDSLPDDFYLKPTLRLNFIAENKGAYPFTLSYLTRNISWNANYNAVWNEENLILTCWVSIDNKSGKNFENVALNIISGEVDRERVSIMRMERSDAVYARASSKSFGAGFEQESFHDFYVYRLDDRVNIKNNQIKQINLFREKKVKAEPYYRYSTHTDFISSMIKFINSEKSGLGIALPKGKFSIYKDSAIAEQLLFAGEDRIRNVALEEEVFIGTGKAFDLVGKTTVLASRRPAANVTERDIEVELKNRSRSNVKINVFHNIRGNWSIYSASMAYEQVDQSTIEFVVDIKADQTFKITWTERIDN